MIGGGYAVHAGLVAALIAYASPAIAGSPCDGVDRSLTSDQKAAWQPIVARQLKAPKSVVLQAFRFAGWSIVYVDTGVSDETFMFFKGDPHQNRYVTLWGGAAQIDEEKAMETWTRKNAPGVPSTLARCFAYHVTRDRDM